MSSPVLASELPRCFAIFDKVGAPLYLAGGRTKIENYEAFEYFGTKYDKVTSGTHTRFYLDPSREKDAAHEGLVHVRCCYNNKYLVTKHQDIPDVVDVDSFVQHGELKTVTVNSFVFAMADEPEEDLSKPSCTLFRILVEETDYHHKLKQFGRHHRVSFVHPQLKEKAGIAIIIKSFGILSNIKDILKEVIILDVSEQIILPPLVAFKFTKDEKNFYLKQIDEQGLQLASTDIGDKNARFQTFNYSNGSVRIQSLGNNKFLNLKYLSDEDRVKPNGSSIEDSALFKALKIGDFIALKVLSGRNKHEGLAANFLSVHGDDWIADGEESITDQTKFRLEEAVVSREIYNVQYHPPHHSRVYDTQNMSLATATAVNRTTKENTIKSSVSITTKKSSKWEATATHKAGVQLTFSAGLSLNLTSILNVNMSMQAQYGYEFSRSDTWGTATEDEKEQTLEYEVTVPANKKVTLSVTAMQAKYDVPFSYTQKDKLYDGRTVIENHDDGFV